MVSGAWFATIGMSSYAVSNTIWAAYLEHDWLPAKITVFRLAPTATKPGITERLDAAFKNFREWQKRFTQRYNIQGELDVVDCDEEDYTTYAKEYRKALKDSADIPRAIDITPGRKFASAIGMQIGLEENVDSIFYLHLLDDSYADVDLPQIPRSVVKLVDFKTGVSP